MNSPFGLIAGEGTVPRRAVDRFQEQDRDVVVAGLEPATEGTYEDVSAFRRFEPHELGSVPDFFNDHDVDDLLMLGNVDKSRLHDARQREQADTVVQGILNKVSDRGDLQLLKAAAQYLRVEGLRLRGLDEVFPDWLTPSGHLAGPTESPDESTVSVLWPLARELADREVGQTVLGAQGSVVALEAIEGTTRAIRRAGELAGKGLTMVKRARSGQDMRFDVPVVGLETVEALVEVGADNLIVEAGMTLWLQRDECRDLAQEHDLRMVGKEEVVWWKRWLPDFNG